ncbi:transporter substrate-binding domain-containing protein [Leuconostoc mesenteroides]|jgi:putative amino-acid transport system substrate-binding protein|uniref:Transporter substrate-binding domain-containing protein n=1 Tax=Leuconostoc mesenteroides TaxID=1245 RepID=A0A843YWK1_LEUME|nr:transporter substrate-binding domain-containing protein [Leuconostoc mesenteroides]MBZ1515271.1 transporter substrate-binding domain-containing protein [Leuconostoc mesenteroides]MBZ1518885.1 transporter substrate-binding domain-containing protein [Leuconostoc mesenteroides]MBZ1520613.1 transporter substrate-binding domain-containing protein [Leuconostoc mesenteroides]MBZ1522046.1 transporter substrate-binding domain-containing protein [Leuconostoc mesenteroides]MBZ1526623.1 transporter sub
MKKRNPIISVIIVVVLIAIVAVGGLIYQTNNHKNEAKGDTKQKVLKIGATGTGFPTAYKSKGKLVGFDVDVINAAAKKAGYKVQWVTGEFDGLLGQLDNNKLDTVANDVAITPERKAKYKFSNIYNKEETTVAVNKDSDYNTLNDLEGKTIAGASASNNTKNLQDYNSKIKFKLYDARDVTFQALLAGHVDGVVNTRNNLEALIKAKNYPWKVVKGSAATVNIALPFRKDDSESAKILKKLNPAINKLKEDGTLKKLSEKYFGYDATADLK